MSSRDRHQDLLSDVSYTLDLQRAHPAGDRAAAPLRLELGLVPPVTGVDARASDSSLGPGFRIVAEQPMYSAAWL